MFGMFSLIQYSPLAMTLYNRKLIAIFVVFRPKKVMKVIILKVLFSEATSLFWQKKKETFN